MRLSWKLFFITMPVFVLILTLFGGWMIQDSFRGSLDREIERCKVENQMFQNSYELTCHSLSKRQQEQMTTRKLVESFYRRDSERGNGVRIYDEDGTVLYQDSGLQPQTSIAQALDETHNVGWELVREDGRTCVVVLARSSLGVLIETVRDISSVFDDRAAQYSAYQLGVLLLAVVVGGLIFLILFLVMRNMQKLSRATRQFARGQYDTRVEVRSSVEIGMLAEDFNWMANAMNMQMQQLQNEVRRQEEFTAAFAHELKTPLTSIIGYADTIRQMELSPEETDMCADYIFRQGKRLQSLSYKLLEMTMTDRQEFKWKEIRVADLLAEVERAVRIPLAEKQIALSVETEDGYIYGDRDLLASVFINLIDNARKAAPQGSTIHVSGLILTGGYLVSVGDEGGGLPEEELARITEPFYMVDKSRARREGGAGLGLALCQKIIELHHGSWQFENIPGSGLRVTVRFGTPELPKRERRRNRDAQRGRGRGRR